MEFWLREAVARFAWAPAGLLFFAYIVTLATTMPGLAPPRRFRAVVWSGLGLGLCATALIASTPAVLRGWLLPPAVLLTSYYASGLLFVRPMPGAERALWAFDRLLRIDAVAATLPRWVAEVLEAAYVGVYPLIPAALCIVLLFTPHPDVDRFWSVVIVTDFICFGVLPWVQTRPPRASLPRDPWRSRVRRLNLSLLGSTSIQVNTFPSGHAAEALAAALLVTGAPWPLVLWMAVNALLVSAGAVYGRYHYAADALAGWLVALGVWMVL